MLKEHHPLEETKLANVGDILRFSERSSVRVAPLKLEQFTCSCVMDAHAPFSSVTPERERAFTLPYIPADSSLHDPNVEFGEVCMLSVFLKQFEIHPNLVSEPSNFSTGLLP